MREIALHQAKVPEGNLRLMMGTPVAHRIQSSGRRGLLAHRGDTLVASRDYASVHSSRHRQQRNRATGLRVPDAGTVDCIQALWLGNLADI
jgi:hypothetical protein